MTTHQLYFIEMNNAAIAMMKEGQYDGAVKRLSIAIRIFRNEELQNIRTNRTSRNHKCTLDQCMIQNEASGEKKEEDNYMYRHGIFLAPALDETSIAAVILFNLGLSYQLMAEQTEEMERRNLLTSMASRFYQIAYETQRNFDLSSNSLFIFATMNNLGLTKTALNEEEAAKQIFQWMLSTHMHMLLLNTAVYQGHMHCVDGFLFNTDNSRPAAAA